jgi:hypothetical protein
MPRIALCFRHKTYFDQYRNAILALRAFVTVRLRIPGGLFGYPTWCIVDSGAPFTAIPYSTWNQGIDWTASTSRFTDATGNAAPELLEWFGTACVWGDSTVELFDGNNSHGPFKIEGKFGRQPHLVRAVENFPVLGLNFLLTNRLRLELGATGGTPTGYLEW